MRNRLAVSTLAVLWLGPICAGQATAPASSRSESPLLFVCERPGPGYRDVVTLDTNELLIGKALEWATDLLLFDGAGTARRLDAGRVRSLAMHRDPAMAAEPKMADLTVAFVEDKGGAGVAIHVLNAGASATNPFEYRVLVGGKPVASGRVAESIQPGAERVIEAPIARDGGLFQVELDTKHENVEIARWNDVFVQPLDGVAIDVVVSKDRYESFRAARNMLDTFCFEDWIQYHFRMLNELFARSIYPTAPEGIRARVRIGRIIVKADLSDEPAQRESLKKQGGSGAAMIVLPRLAKGASGSAAAELVDWDVLRRLGLELGLIDLSKLNAPVGQCMVRDSLQDFVQREFRIPGPPTLMETPGPRVFSELDAAALNRGIGGTGDRAAGSYFPPLPALCALLILDNTGRPLPGCEVSVFQRSDAGREGLVIGGEPIFIGETDARGRFELKGRQGGMFGELARDGANGLFLARISRNGAEEFHFASILDFALATIHGARERFDLPIQTQLAATTAPEAPRFTRIKYDMGDATYSRGFAQFPVGKSADLLEYRFFAQASRSLDWMLFATVPPDSLGQGSIASVAVPLAPIRDLTGIRAARGTLFGFAKANQQGIQGPLSPPRYSPLPVAESVSLAVFPEEKSPTVVFSLAGPVENGLIRSNLNSFHDDYGIRTNAFPGYEPWGGGLAFDARNRMVMTDPHNHQVAWYERAALVQLAGGPERSPAAASSKPGLFNTPVDVAVDDKGRVYVADMKNNRIQELDDRGNFVRIFHEPDEKDDDEVFTRPKALGFSFGKLCVTDLDGERIQIFDVAGKDPKRGRVLRELREADRALVGKSGRVYVPAKDEKGGDAMLIFPILPNLVHGIEQSERSVPNVAQGDLRGPRGFYPCKYPDGTQFGFYVTAFPFVIQRFMLE